MMQAILRPFHYAIVDEADSLLIDDCRNPLIIASRPDNAAKEMFELAHKVHAALNPAMLHILRSSRHSCSNLYSLRLIT